VAAVNPDEKIHSDIPISIRSLSLLIEFSDVSANLPDGVG